MLVETTENIDGMYVSDVLLQNCGAFLKAKLIMRYLLKKNYHKTDDLLEKVFKFIYLFIFTEAVLYNGYDVCPAYCAWLKKQKQKRETFTHFPIVCFN